MTVTPETGRWDALAAARTRGDVGEGIASVLALLGLPDLISFAGGFPDPATFPRERVSALLQEFAAAGEVSAFQYAPTRGLAGPLDALADRLERLQGSRPADDELLITSGGIEALELICKSYLDPGDLVVVEGPTYLGAIQAFRSFEAKLVAVSMDEHGLEVDELERQLAAGLRPKLLYTIPDHQNPAGVSLSAERRAPLVELARRYGFMIVEDVAYRELGFSGDTLPSLWSLAPDVVVQAGTTSKTMFPGIRLGWAVGPADVAARLVSAKQNTDQCAGALGQRLFEECVRRGWIDEQLVLSRALYERKAARLLAALERCDAGGGALDPTARRLLLLADAARRRRLRRSRATSRGEGRRHRAGHAVLPGRPRRGHGAALVQPRRRSADRRRHRAAGVAPVSEHGATHYRWDDMPKDALKPDLARRLISTERMMLAHVYLDKGCIVPKHSHENEQLTYILEGVLRFRLGEDESEVVDVSAGEVLHIPSHLPHMAEALEDTLDVDIFCPPRQDWLDGSDAYLRHK